MWKDFILIKIMKVYFISGLAADSRVFKHIRLPEGCEIIHLNWITPENNESLSSYAERLSAKIDSSEPFALLGLSMGGMIACEIANAFTRHSKKPHITILLSSVPVHHHLPVYFKLFYSLRLHRMIPVQLLKSASLLKRLFAPDTSEDKFILRQVIKDSDPVFIKWAIHAILQWKNETIPQPILHIHGTRDKVLPLQYARPTHIIHNGGHLMVMGNAGELNRLIEEALLSVK